MQLFHFANKEITGVTTYYVDSDAAFKIPEFPRPHFLNAPRLKGNWKNHQFISNINDIVMRQVSGVSEVSNLVEQSAEDSDMSK